MTSLSNILKIKSNNLKPSKGKVLISEPFLLDYYFKRSVVLLAEHNDEGTFGLIINKPVDIKFNDLLKDFPQFDAQIFLGGPVKTDSLFYIHSLGNMIEESIPIIEGLYWGGDIDLVKEMISLGRVSNEEIKFFAGYAGWVPKQLDGELERNSWLVSNLTVDAIMKSDPAKLWDLCLRNLGGEYTLWSNFPADPSMN
ncbi:MAG: YqgE/AlgH family protein [Bacteroidales bacterium]|nr:YqgE/AlgH family protein [Bacteroidales bacterium]